MSTPATRLRGIPLVVIAAIGLVYLATMATYKVTNDVQTSTLMSWRIAQTGAPWFDGFDYSPWESPYFSLWFGEATNGHVVGFRSPGPVAAAVPVYGLLGLLGVDSYSLLPGSVLAAAMTTAALGLFFAAIRARTGDGVAAGAVLALGLATPVWTVSAEALYTHPVTLLGIAGMAWAAARDRWWLLGLFGGVALWGRLHTVLVVAILGLAIAVVRRRPLIAVQTGLVSAVGLGLATLWGRWMYGTWSPAGGYPLDGYTQRAIGSTGGDATDVVVNHLGLWIAPDRGILVWTPVLLLLLPAVGRGWRDLPDWSRWLVVGGIAYTLVQGQLNGFSGGSGFYGYRLTLELLACLFPAYALSVHEVGPWGRRLLGPLLGLQFAVFSLGALGDGGLLAEDVLWTDNSFVHMMGSSPALVVWPVLLTLVGWFVGRLVQRRVTRMPEPHAATSDVGASDQLDRV